MTAWYSKNLGDGMLASEPLDTLEKHFLSVLANTDSPGGMAVFIRHESEGRLHCEVIAYFFLESDTVAKELNARPCEKPLPYGLSLLAGPEDSWSTHFAEPGR
jgi:hypothetical protein